jgi:MoaA/NifB/PqqE/SkfB family radical SAM enzyme
MSDSDSSDMISCENMIYLADLFQSAGDKNISLLGGEPTLHPDFPDFVLYLLERGPLRERSALLKKGECGACRFWAICHGGCPLDSYADHSDFAHKTDWCAAKKLFLEKYFEPITGTRFDPERGLKINHGK